MACLWIKQGLHILHSSGLESLQFILSNHKEIKQTKKCFGTFQLSLIKVKKKI